MWGAAGGFGYYIGAWHGRSGLLLLGRRPRQFLQQFSRPALGAEPDVRGLALGLHVQAQAVVGFNHLLQPYACPVLYSGEAPHNAGRMDGVNTSAAVIAAITGGIGAAISGWLLRRERRRAEVRSVLNDGRDYLDALRQLRGNPRPSVDRPHGAAAGRLGPTGKSAWPRCGPADGTNCWIAEKAAQNVKAPDGERGLSNAIPQVVAAMDDLEIQARWGASSGMRQPHHDEAIAPDRYLRRCRSAGVEPALGLAMDLAPLNRGVLLLVGQTAEGRVCWVERAGLALDVRGRRPTCTAARSSGASWGCGTRRSSWTATPSGRYRSRTTTTRCWPGALEWLLGGGR